MNAPDVDLPATLNIADRFLDARVREGRGDRIAIRTDARSYTYREVQVLANRFGNLLRASGVEPEQRVIIAVSDGPEFVGALFGTLKIGAVAVMLNPELKEEEAAYHYELSGARCAFVGREGLMSYGAAARGRPARHLRRFFAVGERMFETQLSRASDVLVAEPTHRDDPAIWLFSGGTTGFPKAVVQPHGSFANTTELYGKRVLGLTEDDITISVPKLFFGYATGANLFFPFSVGASTVLFPEKPTPDVLFAKIRRHRPTVLVNVPTMINRMVSHPDARSADLSSLRVSTSAGEALPAELYRRWKEAFGVEVLDGLGTAEMWHIFISGRPGEVKPGTIGKVVPGFEVKVCDDEGREVPAGETGELWVRGRSRALGYWRNLEKTAAAFRGEWYVTGDLVSRDAEGWITYCGRKDDMLKVAGRWLAPAEVESCLLTHPAVKECAVVGVRDADGLTKPRAFVIPKAPREGLDEELRAYCLQRLDAYKHPREVVLVDALPRTHLGKVDRGALKAMGAGTPAPTAS